MKIFILVLCLFILSKNISYSSELVEIYLLDNLDDERGFCIDIKGHKSRAKLREEYKLIPVTVIKAKFR